MKEENTYQSINQRINQSIRHYRVPSEVEKDTALTSLLEKIHNDRKSRTIAVKFPLWLRSSAAVAAILIVAVITWVMLATETIRNEGPQVASLRLPDHSRIVLSPQSSVRFKKLYWNRIVRLEGKAYFEVTKGNRFRVETANGTVEVLGTRFLVNETGNQMEVICYEGKVSAGMDNDRRILTAGSGALITPGGSKTLMEEENYPRFARFKGNYDAAPLKQVMQEVEKFYGITIHINSNEERSFSGSIDTGNLEAVLEIITGSLGLTYEFADSQTIEINQSIN